MYGKVMRELPRGGRRGKDERRKRRDEGRRGDERKMRYKFLFPLFILSFFIVAVLAYSEDKFRLKTGAKGNICLNCHEAIQESLKSRFVHPLLKMGECSGCHDPHTSSHEKLLIADVNNLCSGCHKKVIPEKARSTHKVVKS